MNNPPNVTITIGEDRSHLAHHRPAPAPAREPRHDIEAMRRAELRRVRKARSQAKGMKP